MSNAKILESKKAIVEELAEKIKNASAGVFVDYQGITVAEDTELRAKFREADVDYSVIKNTLARLACQKAGYDQFDSLLNGTTSLALSVSDSIAPCRIVSEYVDKLKDKFEIKGGFVEGKVFNADEIKALGAIPSKESLLSMVLGTLLAPVSSFACVIDQIAKAQGGESAAE